MADIKIEGNLDNISDKQLNFIKNVIMERGFKECKIVIEPVGIAGDNYVANVKRITVQDKSSSLKMIAKIAPNLEAQRLMSGTELLFRNEHIMYTKILPKFKQLQNAADIPKEGMLKFAECYGSLEEAPQEVILLEDLKESGFVMLNRFQPLSNECVKSVLKNFALLHSFSYVLKHKEPALFNEYKNDLFDMWADTTNREDFKMFFSKLQADCISILENNTQISIIKDVISMTANKTAKFNKIERDSRYAIIQQGDAWTNNILFKYEKEELLESIMIDYQVSKVSNPVVDLHYMIFNCTDYQSRKEYFHDWIDYYHSELDISLSAFGLKANYIYPKDQLDADLKRYGKVGLGISLILTSMLILKPEDAIRIKDAMDSADVDVIMKNSGIDQLGADSIALFKSKVEGLINSYTELGLVNI